jgi:hypothetical protein
MWAINRENPAIEISETLKTKGREGFLTLCTVKVTTWTISPLNVDNIHGSAASWQTNVGVVQTHSVQLCDGPLHINVLLLHVDDGIKESIKKFAYL